MTITKFDKPTLKALCPRLDAAVAEIGKGLGISLRVGNISFDEFTFTAQLKASIEGGEDKKLATALELYGPMSGVDHTRVAIDGHSRLVGYNTNARGKPWIFEKVPGSGQRYVCDTAAARRYWPVPVKELSKPFVNAEVPAPR